MFRRKAPPRTSRPNGDADRDLGFGSVVASRSAGRLLNRDGTFNNRREGLGWFASLHIYDALLRMSWRRFLLFVVASYLFANGVFAVGYTLLGEGALEGVTSSSWQGRLVESFFFSVHTMSTVGYGNMVPATLGSNLLMTAESIVGLLGVALTTGLVFARFSRPTARILFSDHAVVAPYRDGQGFMFRIANRKRTQILELEAEVVFSRMEEADGRTLRRFYPLPLERSRVSIFPLAWTIVHPIDENSPLHGTDSDSCQLWEAEILVLLRGIDETFSQLVHTRSSYKAEEVIWNARFTDIFLRNDEGAIVGQDLGRLSEIERLSKSASSS